MRAPSWAEKSSRAYWREDEDGVYHIIAYDDLIDCFNSCCSDFRVERSDGQWVREPADELKCAECVERYEEDAEWVEEQGGEKG